MLEEIKELAVKAGNKVMEFYNTDFEVDIKKDDTPVTVADKEANKIILEGLKQFNIPILSEESVDDKSRLNSKRIFIVDPIDGTKNFIRKEGNFTINIALVEDGHPILGVIYEPNTKELFYAEKGKGAFKNGKTIHVSNRQEILVTTLTELKRSPQTENFLSRTIIVGSSMKGCRVAEGVGDINIRPSTHWEWDVAAMQIIVEEAGGVVKHLDNSDLIYNKEVPKQGCYYMSNKEMNISQLQQQ